MKIMVTVMFKLKNNRYKSVTMPVEIPTDAANVASYALIVDEKSMGRHFLPTAIEVKK
jgi:hypothetical protein